MELIRILHASDLHIAKRADVVSGLDRISAGISRRMFGIRALKKTAFFSSYNPARLLAFAQFVYDDYIRSHVNQQDAPIDAIVLTGDIATSGRDKDLKRALWFFEDQPDPLIAAKSSRLGGVYATLAAMIDNRYLIGPVAMPLLLLPGNHDRLQPGPIVRFDYWPGGTNFDQILENYWDPNLNAQKWGPDVTALTVTKNTLSISIIAVDLNLKQSSHRTGRWYNRYAQGRVYQGAFNERDILGDLKQATRELRKKNADGLIVWATHFPPGFPGISSTMQLIDEKDLIKAANDLDVFAILSGHTHIPVRYRTPITQFDVFCAGSATQFDAPLGNHFQILEIEGTDRKNATVRLVNYKYDEPHGAFIPQ